MTIHTARARRPCFRQQTRCRVWLLSVAPPTPYPPLQYISNSSVIRCLRKSTAAVLIGNVYRPTVRNCITLSPKSGSTFSKGEYAISDETGHQSSWFEIADSECNMTWDPWHWESRNCYRCGLQNFAENVEPMQAYKSLTSESAALWCFTLFSVTKCFQEISNLCALCSNACCSD